MDLAVAERRHQRQHVPHLVQHPERAQVVVVADIRAVGAAVAAQIRRQDVVAGFGEGRHQPPPTVGELREAVQQQDAGARSAPRAGLEHVHPQAVHAIDEARADAGRQNGAGVGSDRAGRLCHRVQNGTGPPRGTGPGQCRHRGNPGPRTLQELAPRQRGRRHRRHYAIVHGPGAGGPGGMLSRPWSPGGGPHDRGEADGSRDGRDDCGRVRRSGARAGACRRNRTGDPAVRGHRRAPLRPRRGGAVPLRHGQPRGHRRPPGCRVGDRVRRPRGGPAAPRERGRQEHVGAVPDAGERIACSTPRPTPGAPARSISPIRTSRGCTGSTSIRERATRTRCSSSTMARASRSSSSRSTPGTARPA